MYIAVYYACMRVCGLPVPVPVPVHVSPFTA